MAGQAITERLNTIRRRFILVGTTSGLFWGLVVAAGVLLFGAWLDLLWELSPETRIGWILVSGVAGLVLLGLFSCLSFYKSRDRDIVRRLDRAAACGGTILSGWELSTRRCADTQPSALTLTSGLANIAVSQADALASDVSPSDAVSSRSLRVSSAVFSTLVLITLVFVFCLPSLAKTQWDRFTKPYSDVPPFSPVEFEVDPGDTKVVYGDGLDVNVNVTGGTVEQVELIFVTKSETESLPMFSETDGGWRAAIAKVTEDAQYYVQSENARSKRYRIDVVTTPKIEDVRFRVTPPKYTRDAPYEGKLPKGGISGLIGTEVEVWATSNRPLAAGVISVFRDDEQESIQMTPVSDRENEVAGKFTVQGNGKFELRVVDVDQQESRESLGGTIILLVDQRPFVRLIEPKPQSLATPSANVPVTVAAEDDYGLSRIQIYRSLNDSRPLPMELPLSDPPPRRVQDRIFLPLHDYGLVPGDTIKLFARVEDNDPSGAKGAESSVATIRIISQEEFERMVRVREGLQVLLSKYQQAQRRMEGLAEEIEELREQLRELPEDSPAAEKLREQLGALSKKFQQEAEAIKQSAQHLLPYDLDKNLTEQLQQLAKQLDEAAKSLEKLGEDPELTNKLARQKLSQLAKSLAGQRKQFQKDANEPLEHLAQVFPLMECQSRFTMLVMRQVDLAERLAAMKGRDGEDDPALKARMRDLEEEQRRIREELKDLLDEIEQNANRLPDEEIFDKLRQTALKFVDDVRASGASEAMTDAEAGLAEFSGTQGYENAKKAADILLKFLSQCQGMGDAAGQCLAFNPSLSNCLGNTIQQLLGEAGLSLGRGSGPGLGTGQGNGYSARQSGMNNVGLYGGLPALGSESQSGFGTGDSRAESPGGYTGGANSAEPSIVETDSVNAAVGSTGGLVPIRYRERVGQYLQRLAEELDE